MPAPVNRLEQTRGTVARLMSNPAFTVIAFFAIHIPLAMVMRSMPAIATLHAAATMIVGIWWALRGREMERVAYVAAYVAGAEVLWRMNGAEIFWEFAKYATSAMFFIALIRLGRLKGSTAAFLYFMLLLPSASQTLMNLDIGHARRQLSFNLSGPFALMMSAWFFSNLKVSKVQLQRIFLAFMGPVAGVAGVAISGTLTAVYIQFTTNSNAQTSGGFGPNQVSAVFGLAAFLAFFCLIHDKTHTVLKAVLIASVIVFATQSAMTFSRGGLYAAAGSALLAGLFLIREKRGTARLLQVAPVLFVVAIYVIVPQIITFTGGAISERFQKTNLTRRGDLMQADVEIWRENPIFGVGPGMGADLRGHYGEHIASHTEFTRLLSEHGVFGIGALVMLLGIGVRTFLSAKGAGGKALTVSLMAWSFLFMSANGMRLVAPSFTFGLACATVVEDKRSIRRVRRAVPVADRVRTSEDQEPWRDPGSALPAI
jgi:O-Antigen ligase